MAAIGARMLAPEKAGVEAQGTLMMRQNGESSVLASIAEMVSDGLTKMLQFMGEWAGVTDPSINVSLNTDFHAGRLERAGPDRACDRMAGRRIQLRNLACEPGARRDHQRCERALKHEQAKHSEPDRPHLSV
jgi:hypothetical protein